MKYILVIFFQLNICFANSLKIVSYNVKNLFDNDNSLSKITAISEVIKSIGKVNLVVLQEVANNNVLSKLSQEAGFSHFKISNSVDTRSINIAIMFNLNNFLKKVDFEEIKPSNNLKTRSILKLKLFISDNKKITFLCVHLPSQLSPKKNRMMMLEQLEDEIKKISSDDYIIIGGDFNSFEYELKDHFKNFIHRPCLGAFTPPGSYYYHQEGIWNRFDRFYLTQNIQKFVKDGCYQIFYNNKMTTISYVSGGYLAGSTITGVPDAKNYSDHFPIVLDLLIN